MQILNKAYMGNQLQISVISIFLLAGMTIKPVEANDRYTDQGRVLKVTPQYERVNTPRQTCDTQYREVVVQPRKSMTGSVIGGIAGGLLGSQIGKGNGRVAAAAIGAGIGAITGDRISRRQPSASQVRSEPYEVCRTVDRWHREKVGYLVDYEYQGRQYTMQTDCHPGDYVDLDVTVTPVASVQLNSNVYMTEYQNAPLPRNRHFHKKQRRHHYY